MKLERTNLITFDPVEHTYTTSGGQSLTPVSSVLDTLEPPFDAEGKSYGMAKREILFEYNLLELPTDPERKWLYDEIEAKIQDRARLYREKWAAIGQESIDFGNWIDENLSNVVEHKRTDPKLQLLIDKVQGEYNHYHREFSQFMVFDEELGVCGTCDRLSIRMARSNVVDITDYKTGINKGMTYDNLKIKDGIHKYYNKFYLPPLDHIEICSYARYTMQLSTYAFLLQRMFPDVKIGRLRILFIHRIPYQDEPGRYLYEPEFIPVFYQKHEVETLLDRVKVTKEMLGEINQRIALDGEMPTDY